MWWWWFSFLQLSDLGNCNFYVTGDTELVEDAPSEALTFIQFIHHSFPNMVRELKKVVSRCPHIARMYSIGRSFEGKDLFVVEFSTSPGHHELREY